MILEAYSFLVFSRAYVGTCVQMYVLLYECVYVCTYVHDPVRLGFRHLYQVEFCSFIVRYPTAGASVYYGHISSSLCEVKYTKFSQVHIEMLLTGQV